MFNHQSSGSRGKAIATPPAAAVNCPRCDSPNTKFCYYNNYSLSQPRHFCKACKRYWTKGGALRNVPIGGGCRKSKKTSKSSSVDSKDLDMGRFKLYEGLDFQLGGGLTKFPSFNNISTPPTVGGQLVSSFGDIPTLPIASSAVSNFGFDPNSGTSLSQFMAFNNFPLSYPSSILKQDGENNNIGSFNEGLVPEMGPTYTGGNGNLASPMESFGSINQDLHWNLQQERMGLMLNGGNNDIYQQQNGIIGTTSHLESLAQAQKPQAMLFHNSEISSKPAGDSGKEVNGIVNATTANLPTEWNFGSSSYATNVNQFPSSNGNGKGIQGWANFDKYTSLP